MKLPTPNKDIRQLGKTLIEQYGFTFIGLDSGNHLEFRAPNGAVYKLSSTPKGTFSSTIELPRALKLAGIAPQQCKRDTQQIRERAARARQEQQDRNDKLFAARLAAVEREDRRHRIDRRRRELFAISYLMGAGRPRTF